MRSSPQGWRVFHFLESVFSNLRLHRKLQCVDRAKRHSHLGDRRYPKRVSVTAVVGGDDILTPVAKLTSDDKTGCLMGLTVNLAKSQLSVMDNFESSEILVGYQPLKTMPNLGIDPCLVGNRFVPLFDGGRNFGGKKNEKSSRNSPSLPPSVKQ